MFSCNQINKKILAINYSKDTRYDMEANIFSHDKQKFEANIALEDLGDLLEHPLTKDSDVIVIDEIQFFPLGPGSCVSQRLTPIFPHSQFHKGLN